jgi:hypothetical protein
MFTPYSIDITKERLWLVNVKTMKLSKKSWKTYKGALKNASPDDMIVTLDGFAWMLKHPEYDYSKRIN